MPAGLLVWDANGNLQVDTTTFLGRYIGQTVIGNGTGTIVSDRFREGTPWCIPIMDNQSLIDPNTQATGGFIDIYSWASAPTVAFSGNQLVWTRNTALTPADWSVPNCTLVYGVN